MAPINLFTRRPSSLGEGLRSVVESFGGKGGTCTKHVAGMRTYSNGVTIKNFDILNHNRVQVRNNGNWCLTRDYLNGGSAGVYDARKIGNSEYTIHRNMRHKNKKDNGTWYSGSGSAGVETFDRSNIQAFFIRNVLDPIASLFKK